MIKFLELEKHCPEVLINQPQEIESIECNQVDNEQFYVTHCKFVEKLNIFIICLTDTKKKSSSKLEVHSFKQLSPLNESYGQYLAKKDRKDKYELLDEPL
jgi:hypothetical protein